MFISPPEHLNYFSRIGLIRLMAGSGFQPAFIETVSKIPRRYVRRILKFEPLVEIGTRTGYALMKITDALRAGMVLNAYFRKT